MLRDLKLENHCSGMKKKKRKKNEAADIGPVNIALAAKYTYN